MTPWELQLALTSPQWLIVYLNDVKVVRSLRYAGTGRGKKGNKKAIKELTKGSLKRLAFFGSNTAQRFYTMVTLTYPQNHTNDGKLVKRHFNTFLTALRYKRKNIKYFWYLEFQFNGSAHFHIFLSTKYLHYKWIAETWNRIVSPDDADHLVAGTSIERIRDRNGANKYIVKYGMKTWQKLVPLLYQFVGRFWGFSQGIEPKIQHEIQVTGYDDARYWLRFWSNAHLVNHDLIISTLWNVAKHMSIPQGLP